MLKDNPFYILDVSMAAGRNEIVSKAEEQAFFADPEACNNAQAILLNPVKRLEAELDWFSGE